MKRRSAPGLVALGIGSRRSRVLRLVKMWVRDRSLLTASIAFGSSIIASIVASRIDTVWLR